MTLQGKNMNDALPNGFTIRPFVHPYGLYKRRGATVLRLNNLFKFFRRNFLHDSLGVQIA
jgi:hypothetical protein